VQGRKESATTLPKTDRPQGEQPIEESELDTRDARNCKATKSDDAKAPVYLWDGRVAAILVRQHPAETPLDTTARDRLDRASKLMLQYWKRMVKASFRDWYEKKLEEH
jgi:hypothetical protein